MFPTHHVGMEEAGLPRSSAVRNQSCNGTSKSSEVVDDALTLCRYSPVRTLTAPLEEPMSSEPIAATPTDDALAAEKGLLIAVLLMVLLGTAAMLLI